MPPDEVILPELNRKLGIYAQRKLAARGVEIIAHAKVSGINGGVVQLTNGDKIPANTLIWTATGWRGDNTDGVGLVRDLRHNLAVAIAGKRLLVLGSGGAARGILEPLQVPLPLAHHAEPLEDEALAHDQLDAPPEVRGRLR